METLAVQRRSSEISFADHQFNSAAIGRAEPVLERLEDVVAMNAESFGAGVRSLMSMARSIDTASLWLNGASESTREGRVETLHFTVAATSYAHRQVRRVAEEQLAESPRLSGYGMQVLDSCLSLGKLMGQAADELARSIADHAAQKTDPFGIFVRGVADFEERRLELLHSLKRSV